MGIHIKNEPIEIVESFVFSNCLTSPLLRVARNSQKERGTRKKGRGTLKERRGTWGGEKIEAGTSRGDFLKTGKWNTPLTILLTSTITLTNIQ